MFYWSDTTLPDHASLVCLFHIAFFPSRVLPHQAGQHLRTIPDPEFPGEDEHLYFVMVELNMDDIKELKRVTQLEMQGTLDSEGLQAFVEVL